MAAQTDGLRIRVSQMSDQRYEFLVGMHESDRGLSVQAGQPSRRPPEIDLTKPTNADVSQATTANRETTPEAPYHKEHMFASKVERMLADQLNVNWGAYDREVSSK